MKPHCPRCLLAGPGADQWSPFCLQVFLLLAGLPGSSRVRTVQANHGHFLMMSMTHLPCPRPDLQGALQVQPFHSMWEQPKDWSQIIRGLRIQAWPSPDYQRWMLRADRGGHCGGRGQGQRPGGEWAWEEGSAAFPVTRGGDYDRRSSQQVDSGED